MFAGIIFQKEPFFKGDDNYDQLVKIVKFLGSEKFDQYVFKYNIDLDPHFGDKLSGHRGRTWEHYAKKYYEKNPTGGLVNEEAIDLLDKLLRFDHHERILPLDAMKHPYFDPINKPAQMEEDNEGA